MHVFGGPDRQGQHPLPANTALATCRPSVVFADLILAVVSLIQVCDRLSPKGCGSAQPLKLGGELGLLQTASDF